MFDHLFDNTANAMAEASRASADLLERLADALREGVSPAEIAEFLDRAAEGQRASARNVLAFIEQEHNRTGRTMRFDLERK